MAHPSSSSNLRSRAAQPINGTESFWSYATRRLAKFNGVPRHTFNLHLNETE